MQIPPAPLLLLCCPRMPADRASLLPRRAVRGFGAAHPISNPFALTQKFFYRTPIWELTRKAELPHKSERQADLCREGHSLVG